MKNIFLYLHVHQPQRLRDYTIFDIGQKEDYFSKENENIFNKVAKKSYLPTNYLLQKLLYKYPEFKINFSITGTFIEQAKEYNPEVLKTFINLAKTKKVDILAETYYHSLAALYSKSEFERQVLKHIKTISSIFGIKPTYFRNTELIYSNKIAQYVENLNFKGIITEGTEKILHWRSPNYLYRTNTNKGINLLLKNYKLSDDIAWRFSNKNWEEYPLTTDKYIHWLDNTPGETINLFMDYETFGEHQWEDTGIFNFVESFVGKAISKGYTFRLLKDTDKFFKNKGTIDCPFNISWADEERDTTAWTENAMQQDMLKKIYALENIIINSKNRKLIDTWRHLQVSDHFYYMCTKWFSDGDAHAYFSPYKSPYQAYNTYNNVYIDLKERIGDKLLNTYTQALVTNT